MSNERLVLDTNVLISAALFAAGTPGQLLDMARRRQAVLLFSPETMHELRSRLLRPKFDRYISLSLRQRFLAEVDAIAETVAITATAMGCRDSDDDKFLETAVVGQADCLVTGDKDLLTMHPFRVCCQRTCVA